MLSPNGTSVEASLSVTLSLVLIAMSVGAAAQHSLAHDPSSCSEEASLGAALLQTSKGALSVASGQIPNPAKLIEAGGLHTFSGVPGSFSLEVVSLGAIVFILGCFLYWYTYFYKEAGAREKPPLEADGEADGTASAADSRSLEREAIGSKKRWRKMEDGDSDDAGDWNPLESMPLGLRFGTEGIETRGTRGIESITEDAEKHNNIWDYLEESNSSWTIFFRVMGHLAQVWGMLGLMYWSLLARDDELMDCLAHPHGKFVSHLCTYTHACLRGFPILAANVSLVLMMRILVQNRIYYSLLQLGYVLDFADSQVLRSSLPWLFAFSMLQGGAHLVLKMWFDPNPIALDSYVGLVKTFIVPGAIFVSFFVRFAEIENTLIPLNRLVERDYKKGLDENEHARSGDLPCLSTLKALNERVLCYDARNRDIVGNAMEELGRAPKLDDILQNIIDTYAEASEMFYTKKKHYSWGFFRSLWPAAVLVDKRLDRDDPKTRSWLATFLIVAVGSLVVSFFSTCFFISSIYRNIKLGYEHHAELTSVGPLSYVVTESALGNFVLSVHAFYVLYFVHKTIRGMFYFEIKTPATYLDSTGEIVGESVDSSSFK